MLVQTHAVWRHTDTSPVLKLTLLALNYHQQFCSVVCVEILEPVRSCRLDVMWRILGVVGQSGSVDSSG